MISDKEKNEIEKYFESCNYFLFCKVEHRFLYQKIENSRYWMNILAALLDQRNRELYKNKDFQELIDLLTDYNKKLYFLTSHIVGLYKLIEPCRIKNDYTAIALKKNNVFNSLMSIEEYSEIVKLNLLKNNPNNAFKVREYCALFFDSWIDVLKSQFGIDVYKSPLKREFKTVKKNLHTSINFEELKIINALKNSIDKKSAENEVVKPNEIYKTQNLFKVGLLFATGKMNKYFTVTNQNKTVMNEGFSAPKIAIEVGDIKYEKWILATIKNYNNTESGNKNIFNSPEMMIKIIEHCKSEKLIIDPYFTSRLSHN
jgi:hypothetical protein